MKALLFGQIGLGKKRCLSELEDFVRSKGKVLKCFHIGQMMYSADPTIKPHRILQKDISELTSLRSLVWGQMISDVSVDDSCDCFLINSHSVFRWSRGLFSGFTKKEIQDLNPDICITLIDDIHDIKYSFQHRQYKPESFTLKDIIIWREEEILAAEFAASLVCCKHYIVTKKQCPDLIYKLIFQNDLKKAYLSYPITLVRGIPEIWSQITSFRQQLSDQMICFDPYSISEGFLQGEYDKASVQKRRKLIDISVESEDAVMRLPINEIKEVIPNIQGQIVARDFQLINQSDMVIAYIPVVNGLPAISQGVERELAHAQKATLDTYVIWPYTRRPSPFLESTRTFNSLEDLLANISSL